MALRQEKRKWGQAELDVLADDNISGGCSRPDRLTCAVLVHLHRSVVHLSHSLHLNVFAMAIVFPLPVDVRGEILRHVVGEIVSVLHLERRSLMITVKDFQ